MMDAVFFFLGGDVWIDAGGGFFFFFLKKVLMCGVSFSSLFLHRTKTRMIL